MQDTENDDVVVPPWQEDLDPPERSRELTNLFHRYAEELAQWEQVYRLAPDRYVLKQLEIMRDLVADIRDTQKAFVICALNEEPHPSLRQIALASGVAPSTASRWVSEAQPETPTSPSNQSR